MKTLRCCGLLALLAACGGTGPKEAVSEAPSPPAEIPDLAKPVLEPLRMRELINRDLDAQRDQARDREAMFDAAVSGGR